MSVELEALQESITAVLTDVCDRRTVHDFVDGKSDLDTRLWAQAAELGWLACAVPEDDGGLGMGPAGLDLLNRELGAYLAPGPFLSTLAAAQWIADAGDATAKDRYLPAILAGEMSVAIPALLGVGAATARKDGPLRMLGSDSATLAVVPGKDGALRLVELSPNEGRLTASPFWDRTRQICDLVVEDLPEGSVVAGDDSLLAQFLGLGIAADSLGAARAIALQTVEYQKERVQFGKPVATFQALKHRAADLIARLMVQDQLQAQAVHAVETGADAMMWTALAKAGATEAAAFVSGDCIQLHGGVGFTWEFDPHLFAKRCRLNEMLLAPNGALRDQAADLLAAAIDDDRSTADLTL